MRYEPKKFPGALLKLLRKKSLSEVHFEVRSREDLCEGYLTIKIPLRIDEIKEVGKCFSDFLVRE